jgi:hypothetical protein
MKYRNVISFMELQKGTARYLVYRGGTGEVKMPLI